MPPKALLPMLPRDATGEFLALNVARSALPVSLSRLRSRERAKANGVERSEAPHQSLESPRTVRAGEGAESPAMLPLSFSVTLSERCASRTGLSRAARATDAAPLRLCCPSPLFPGVILARVAAAREESRKLAVPSGRRSAWV